MAIRQASSGPAPDASTSGAVARPAEATGARSTEPTTADEDLQQALEATRKALARTQALYRVSSAQLASESLEVLLQRVVDTMVDVLPAWRVHMIALDMDRKCVVGNYRGGVDAEQLADIDYDEQMEGLSGWTIRHGHATISPGGIRDPRESDRVHERRAAYGHGSMLVAPMLYGERAHGMIAVLKRPDEGEFDQADLELVSEMARQAAMAIESTEVREALRAARDELEVRVALRTAELAESEERYRRITESITDYVYSVVFHEDGRLITTHRPGSLAVTGYAPEDFERNPDLWAQMVEPEDREAVFCQASDLREKHAAAPIEHRIVRKDGVVRYVRSTLVPHLDPTGKLLGWDGLIQDVSERRALETQLRQAQKMEAVGQLAGGIAHDFNNLLTAILGNAELASVDIPRGTPTREAIDEIVKAGQRAASLTRKLLAFASKQIIAPVRLNLSSVVSDSTRMLSRLLGEHIEIDMLLDPHLDPIEADPTQMEQVLVNLTLNARDAMPNGGHLAIETRNETVLHETTAVSLLEVKPGRYVVLTVTDTGEGMPPDVLAHIFEPFFTTKELGKGTGLGLAVCHGIVTGSGGYISVFSQVGLGSTFRIMLPVARGDAPAPTEDTPTPASIDGTETVLVVEDEPSVRRLAVLGLRAHGYTVMEARDGQIALQIAADPSLHFDVVVSDVVMPNMSGPDLARQLETMRPGVPVILVSGHAEQSVLDRAGIGTAFSFLQKPFTPEALARRVRDVLEARA